MSSLPGNYLERVYSGFLGKNVGIRLGAPVEPAIWTYQRIREIYGDVTAYLKPYRNFAADDDANGPVYFVRPLLDAIEGAPGGAEARARARELEPALAAGVATAWLDYAREGAGMFWWGGYGKSTEHTAYLNLKNGIPAPESGSIARNGIVPAQQIGGQIFIDTWGLVWPGNPRKAAEYAAAAASVSHDGEGLHGARFIAACIAAAFTASDIRTVVEDGLAQIPSDSKYSAVARAVIDFHTAHPDDWRACQEFLIAEWGYDKWPGLCHIIPNAGVCVLALLYGAGNFSRTVEIATMCGWDTDCNAGNVGTIAGVLYGLDAIPAHYRGPVNDGIVLSGLPGALNILDIPTFCRRLCATGYILADQDPPPSLSESLARGDGESGWNFDFSLPGSTHCLRVSDPVAFSVAHRAGAGIDGGNAAEFRFERIVREVSGTVFWKPLYRRADFDDERYSPVFSPAARPGQKVSIGFRMERWEGQNIGVEGYVRDTFDKRIIPATETIFVKEGTRYALEFAIPDLNGSFPDEIGLRLTSYTGAGKRDSGRLLIDSFTVGGSARYSIDMAKQTVEFNSVTPFSHDGGNWSIIEGRLHLMTPSRAFSYTGGFKVGDQKVTASVTPLAGDSMLLAVRVCGATKGYFGGFDGEGRVAIYLNDSGATLLAHANFPWKRDVSYEIGLEAKGDRITLSVDGVTILDTVDRTFAKGMIGCGSLRASRALFGPFRVEEN